MNIEDIPTAEVWKDLKENDAEMVQLRNARTRLSATTRLEAMKIRAMSTQISEHEKLSTKLRKILKARGEDVMV